MNNQNERMIKGRKRTAYQIATDPDPMEPFNLSQGFRIDDLIIISGQAAINDNGEIVGENDFDLQAEQTFKNVQAVLEAGGSSLENIIKVTIYLTDMNYFPKIIELREKYFTKPFPADTIVEVSSLALPELLIEIEAIALVK